MYHALHIIFCVSYIVHVYHSRCLLYTCIVYNLYLYYYVLISSYPNTARALCGASRFHAPWTGCPSTIRSASRAPRESRAFRAFSRVARTHTRNSEDKGGLDVAKFLTWIILLSWTFLAYLCYSGCFAFSVTVWGKTFAHCLPLSYVFFCETCSLSWGQKNLMWLKRPQLLITKARIQLTFWTTRT